MFYDQSMQYPCIQNLKKTEKQLITELDNLLIKNIKEMIPQNRKFASIVSGGIDSSLVTALMQRISKKKIKMLSLGLWIGFLPIILAILLFIIASSIH